MPQGEVIGSAWVEINSNIGQLQREIAGLKGHVDSSARNIETRFNTATKAISGMASVVGTVGLIRFGSDILKSSTQVDTLNRMLINVEGSQEKANKRFEQFRILAKEPVLDPFNLSKFYVQLKSVNVEGELSINFMKSLANVMAGVGASNEQFSMAMTQFAQMAGQGKLIGQDLRVITESFPQIRKYLREAFEGVSDPEQLAKGGHTAIEIFTKLNEVMEKAPHFAGGAQAAQDNFRQSLVLFEASLGKNLLPTFAKFLDSLTAVMDRFSALPDSMKAIIGGFTIAGGGILGITFAVNTLNRSLEILGMSAGLKGLMGLSAKTAVAAGAVGGSAVSAFSKITSVALTVAKATIEVGAAAIVGIGLSKLLPYPEFAKPSPKPGAPFTPEEQKKLDKLMKPIRASIIGTESSPEMQAIVEKNKARISENLPVSKVAIPVQSLKSLKDYEEWASKSGEGYYATIDEKIAKLKELRDAHQLEPTALREVNNMITDLLKDRNDIYKQSYDEWQEILKSGQKQGFDIVTRGYEDIALRSGKQKIPVMTETGAFTTGFELPETAKREIPLPEKKPGVMEFGYNPDDWIKLGESARAYTEQQEKIANFDQDMIALSGELARKDEMYIANIKEKTQALDKAGVSAEDYAQALENVKKNTHEISQFKAEIKIKPDSVIDALDDIEIKYEELYEKADRLNVSKLMVDQAKDADVKAIYDSWAVSLDRTGTSMQGLADDWDDLTDSLLNVKEESKEVSDFWRQMGQEGLSMIESVSDKTVESVFGKMFEKSDIDEAYKDYKLSQEMIRDEDERTGRAFEKGYDLQTMSFHEFSTQYRKEAELNTQSWSEFCKSMVEEFTKALVKIEVEAEARNLWNLTLGAGKTEKGKGTEGGGKTDWVTKLSEGAGITGTVAKGAKWAKGLGHGGEEIAGGAMPEASTATKAATGSAIASALPAVLAIVGTAVWAYKVGEAGYDYWKQKQEFKEQISTPEGLTKTQLAQKDMFQQKFNIGKYENEEEGVYANPKGYEHAMQTVGLEPYPLAKGGMGIVTRPTPFIMGEAGPEMFNIQPLSKVQNEYITNKDTYVSGNRSDNFNVYISFPNATLDSVDQNQIDRFVSKAIPSLRRAVSNGELS